jgi:hypothetical protein
MRYTSMLFLVLPVPVTDIFNKKKKTIVTVQ